MSYKRIIIDAFIDEDGNIQAGTITFPTPGESVTPPAAAPSNGVIKLDPKSVDFESRKKELKAKGYKYNRQTQSWLPPETALQEFSESIRNLMEVKLEKSDRDFEGKLAILKAVGFKWNAQQQVWRRANGDRQAVPEPLRGFEIPHDATEFKLEKSDPDFNSKREAIKAAGFKWNNTRKIWVRPQPS